MRVYLLVRREDISGVSGVGIVAEVVEFSGDGPVVMRWLRKPCSEKRFDRLEHVLQVHGHEGRTRLELIADVSSLDDLLPAPLELLPAAS